MRAKEGDQQHLSNGNEKAPAIRSRGWSPVSDEHWKEAPTLAR